MPPVSCSSCWERIHSYYCENIWQLLLIWCHDVTVVSCLTLYCVTSHKFSYYYCYVLHCCHVYIIYVGATEFGRWRLDLLPWWHWCCIAYCYSCMIYITHLSDRLMIERSFFDREVARLTSGRSTAAVYAHTVCVCILYIYILCSQVVIVIENV